MPYIWIEVRGLGTDKHAHILENKNKSLSHPPTYARQGRANSGSYRSLIHPLGGIRASSSAGGWSGERIQKKSRLYCCIHSGIAGLALHTDVNNTSGMVVDKALERTQGTY